MIGPLRGRLRRCGALSVSGVMERFLSAVMRGSRVVHGSLNCHYFHMLWEKLN